MKFSTGTSPIFKPTHDESIDGRIELHDSNQFEVKLDYSIDPTQASNRYRIETYFFVPRSLGISSDTYSKNDFYSDIQANIRFKTPSLSLSALLDPNNKRTPLPRLEKYLQALQANPKNSTLKNKIGHEIRLFGCLVRANVRNRLAHCKTMLKRPANGMTADAIRPAIQNLLTDASDVIAALRKLAPLFDDPVLPQHTREQFSYVNEYLSLMWEGYATRLVGAIDDDPRLSTPLEPLRNKLTDTIIAERRHRKLMHYSSLLDAEEHDENFIYRQGVLKKFVMSVLFLEINKFQEGKRLRNFTAAIAAGIAMVCSTAAAVFAQQRYGINSGPFLATVVVAYMFKDRIKEWLKILFAHQMVKWLADYDLHIWDPVKNKVVGHCREFFSFIALHKVPQDVRDLRHIDATSVLEQESKPEVVFRYCKEVTLHGKTIGDLHGRLHDINDIIRFNISKFLIRTDDPVRKIQAYNEESGRIEAVSLSKVYHLNIVFVMKLRQTIRHAHNDHKQLVRIRVILDKNGIRRLEEL